MSASLAESAHPLSAFGLDMLARGAARLRGDRHAMSEAGPGASAGRIDYGELDRLTLAFAARAHECGLAPGARVLIVGVPRIGAVVAVLGALTAGLEPVVAPAHLDAGAMAFLAQTSGASALFGPTDYGDLDLEGVLLEAAACAPDVRMLGSLGPRAADGAIDFSPGALASTTAAPARSARPDAPPKIGMALRTDTKTPRAVFIAQNALVEQALEIVAAMQLSSNRPLVSTLSIASVAGLVAGPVAALLSGAPLFLFGPFDATGLTAAIDRAAPCALLAPAAVGKAMIDARLCASLDVMALSGPAPQRSAAPCPVLAIETDGDGRLTLHA